MPQRTPIRVTSTDWLKLVGITAFLIDHYGLFFVLDDEWWRIVGRVAAPIFFFFIGFAKSRSIPTSWIVWGLILTGADWWIAGDFTLNILLNFALIRFALRWVDQVAATPLKLGAVAAASLALLPFAAQFFEYGAEGWLWAWFGFAQRAWRNGDVGFAKARFAFAFVAAFTYAFVEIEEADFEGIEAVGLALITLGLTLALLAFKRTISAIQPPALIAPIIVWISQYSLEIYAISLFLMQDIFYVFQ